MNQTLFNTLLRPIKSIIDSISPSIDQQNHLQKLFFADFVQKLIFGYIYQVSSLRNLSLELQTNPICQVLGLSFTPFSTLKDGFSRFESKYFKQLFETVLEQVDLSKIPFVEELGICRVIDGRICANAFVNQLDKLSRNEKRFQIAFKF